MRVEFFKTLWGHTGPCTVAADQAVAAGFHGLEGPMPSGEDARREFLETLASRHLLYIAEISTTGFAVPEPGSTVQQHLDAFERGLVLSLPGNPVLVTTMAGSDVWDFSDSVEFLTKAFEMAGRHGVRVGFETHRSRSLFHPIIARRLLGEIPEIEITVDFSHWCNVCERLVLDELPDVLELCAERVLHIHARIGYDQGAQVPDPRSPLCQSAVQAHLHWWRILREGQKKRGFQCSTMTPEFGPDGYQQIHPVTGEPYGDLWDFNRHVADLIRSSL